MNTESTALKNLQAILGQVEKEVRRCNFKSHDPYDVLGSRLIVKLRQKKSSPLNSLTTKEPSLRDKIIRSLMAPLYQTSLGISTYRRLFNIKTTQHPKSFGLILQGNCYAYAATGNEEFLKSAKQCAGWLMEHSDKLGLGFHCWGLPWVWPSDVVIPQHGPQSTMSAVIGLGFAHLFELTQDAKYLKVCESVCEFFMQKLHIDKINENHWALSYTPYDKTHILNVNLHCAALLTKTARLSGRKEFLDFAIKISNFSVSHQRSDGAWHYASPLDGDVNAVDNTHTGDKLEYLAIMRENMEAFPFEKAFRLGIAYYIKHFFGSDGQPYYTDQEKYPAESHPAGQSIITLAHLIPYEAQCQELCLRVSNWVTEHLMNKKKNRMHYRIYETGFVDRSYSISWGDAWLVKGLSLLLLRATTPAKTKV